MFKYTTVEGGVPVPVSKDKSLIEGLGSKCPIYCQFLLYVEGVCFENRKSKGDPVSVVLLVTSRVVA